MIAFIMEHLATILVGAALLAVLALICAGLIRKRLRGQSAGCGCGGCSGCPAASSCHRK